HRRRGRMACRLIHYFWRMGDYDHALACGPRALAVTRASGDVFEQARAHSTLGTVAQFLAVCRRSEMVAMGTRRPRRGPRLCRRGALHRRGNIPRLRQILCATKCDKLSDILKRRGLPTAPDRQKTTTWKEFIRTHLEVLWAT